MQRHSARITALLASLTLLFCLNDTSTRLGAERAVFAASEPVSGSTRALYTPRRDDAAPGGATTVRIDATHTGVTPLSPAVFGNFIENLRTVIYDTLWADALHNPDLEQVEADNHEAPCRSVRLALAGFPAGRVSATILTAADPQAGNTWDHPDAVAPRPFPIPARTGGIWAFSLPPHSLVVFTVRRTN